MATTTYTLTTNGITHTLTYTSKARAIAEAEAYVQGWAQSGLTGRNVITVQTVATGKEVYRHETHTEPVADTTTEAVEAVQEAVSEPYSGPAVGTYYPSIPGARTLWESKPLYVGDRRVSVAVETGGLAYVFIGCNKAETGWDVDVSHMSDAEFYAWINDVAEASRIAEDARIQANLAQWERDLLSASFPPVDAAVVTVAMNLTKKVCDWDSEYVVAPYVVTADGWSNYACPTHLAQWFPETSPLCPSVEHGCSHTMAVNGEGVGVACVEYAQSHNIAY